MFLQINWKRCSDYYFFLANEFKTFQNFIRKFSFLKSVDEVFMWQSLFSAKEIKRKITSKVHFKCSLHSSAFFHKMVLSHSLKNVTLAMKDRLHMFVSNICVFMYTYICTASLYQRREANVEYFSIFWRLKKDVSCIEVLQPF